jgi:MoCo/4Fe-4S cofactor protein with predicted Tat translocation signal
MNETESGQTYWRSLQELARSEEFRRHLEAEFPAPLAAAAEQGERGDGPGTGLSRRRFLQLMSASIALAGISGCRWPQEEIVPFAHRPAGYVPGAWQHYATTFAFGANVRPLLVRSRDGRPIKAEGNPLHPLSLGGADVYSQACVLGLYDPQRSQTVVRRDGSQTVPATWEDFVAFAGDHFAALRSRRGAGLAVLAPAVSSPATGELRHRLLAAYPQAVWYEHEPFSRQNEREGTRLTLGRPGLMDPDLADAAVIVSVGCDLLAEHPTGVRNARDFARRRRPEDGRMNRLYCLESTVSATGASADHRFAVAACHLPAITASLAADLFLVQGLPLPPGAEHLAGGLRPFLDRPGRPEGLAAMAADLREQAGRSVVVAGAAQPPAVHGLCLLMNAALGNLGRTMHLRPDEREEGDEGPSDQDIDALMQRLESPAGSPVQTLVILGGNPVYDAPGNRPGSGRFADLLARVDTTIHLGLCLDETGGRCDWHLPQAHPLESWGQALGPAGELCSIQPLIEPLYQGRTGDEILSLIVEPPGRSAHDLARRAFWRHVGGVGDLPADDPVFARRWQRFLRDGWLPARQGAGREHTPVVQGESIGRALAEIRQTGSIALGPDNLELALIGDGKVYDGRFANNAWLQELPGAATKLTWDNAALLSPATAAALKLRDGDMARLEFAGRSLEAPVLILPGQAPWSVALALGYGRTGAGHVGNGVGADGYALRRGNRDYGGPGLALTRTGKRRELACTQDHHAIDARGTHRREEQAHALIREADLATFRREPDFARHMGDHHPPLKSLWKERAYPDHRWAMAIDLGRCIGCNACVMACQAENNIPAVGRDRVREGREMHWIRIDRYFKGEPEAPATAFQPVACVQCENAPCEQVCPVGATMHDAGGLNVMVYNRCVGTRYCSNNCPYKVRRFNFFNYQGRLSGTEKMVRNPEVTVRSRGVMEKCTYCVQRIQAARIEAKKEHRSVRDGEIVPACAQTCPAEAIVLGDLNDPESRVRRWQENPRSYRILAELNTKPRTAYLARVRNPHPDLAQPPAGHADPQETGTAHDDGDGT